MSSLLDGDLVPEEPQWASSPPHTPRVSSSTSIECHAIEFAVPVQSSFDPLCARESFAEGLAPLCQSRRSNKTEILDSGTGNLQQPCAPAPTQPTTELQPRSAYHDGRSNSDPSSSRAFNSSSSINTSSSCSSQSCTVGGTMSPPPPLQLLAMGSLMLAPAYAALDACEGTALQGGQEPPLQQCELKPQRHSLQLQCPQHAKQQQHSFQQQPIQQQLHLPPQQQHSTQPRFKQQHQQQSGLQSACRSQYLPLQQLLSLNQEQQHQNVRAPGMKPNMLAQNKAFSDSLHELLWTAQHKKGHSMELANQHHAAGLHAQQHMQQAYALSRQQPQPPNWANQNPLKSDTLLQLSHLYGEKLQQQPHQQQQHNLASRPASSASSLWSNYDMDPSTEEQLAGPQITTKPRSSLQQLKTGGVDFEWPPKQLDLSRGVPLAATPNRDPCLCADTTTSLDRSPSITSTSVPDRLTSRNYSTPTPSDHPLDSPYMPGNVSTDPQPSSLPLRTARTANTMPLQPPNGALSGPFSMSRPASASQSMRPPSPRQPVRPASPTQQQPLPKQPLRSPSPAQQQQLRRPPSPATTSAPARPLSRDKAQTLKWLQPCTRLLHPAVVMDMALLTCSTKPVDEVPVDESGRPYPYILPPSFPGSYPTMAFMGPAAVVQAAGLQPLLSMNMTVKYAGIANTPVKTAFKEAGWRVTKGKRWTVCWGRIFSAAEFAVLHEFQRVNHFPGTWELGRKDYLYRNVAALKRAKGAGDALSIVPRFFILPRDYDEFRADLECHPSRLYIQKPVNSSRGRGVRVVVNPHEVPRESKDILLQHYINDPYTINGYKFDMRVYVAATCVDPLRVYIYHDGLARFATEAYSGEKADLKKRCMHLTNYTINKKSSKFAQNQGLYGTGCAEEATDAAGGGNSPPKAPFPVILPPPLTSKWSLKELQAHVEAERGKPAWQAVWAQVHDIVVGAMLAAEPRINTEVKMKVPHRNVCFEVWGFDIMLDSSLKAWLIEVNTCPALNADSPLDKHLKTSMVSDLMNLVGPIPYDFEAYEIEGAACRQARLTGLLHKPDGRGSSGVRKGTTIGPGSAPSSTKSSKTTDTSAEQDKFAGEKAAAGRAGSKSTTVAALSGAAQIPKTLREAQEVVFHGLAPEQLPDIIIEAEAELARCRGWERAFPCIATPTKYLDLFQTPRASNIMLCNYYAQKGGAGGRAPSQKLQRVPSGGATRSRPGGNNWRPGGGG